MLSAGSAVALVALYAIALGTSGGRRIDASAEHELAYTGGSRLDALNHVILVSVDPVLVLAAALAGFFLLRGRVRDALAAGALLALVNGLAYGLKLLLYWLDPLGGEAARTSDVASFPSGHTAAAISAGLVAIVLAPRTSRVPVTLACAVYAAAVGLASVADGGHYPSDVAASYLIAMVVAGGVAASRRLTPARLREPAPSRGQTVALTGLVAVVSLAGASYWVDLALAGSDLATYVRDSPTAAVVAPALGALSILLVCTYGALCGAPARPPSRLHHGSC